MTVKTFHTIFLAIFLCPFSNLLAVTDTPIAVGVPIKPSGPPSYRNLPLKWESPINANMPYSSREMGMANIGICFPLDNTSFLMNPANLGDRTSSHKTSELSYAYCPFYPTVGLNVLYQSHTSFSFLPSAKTNIGRFVFDFGISYWGVDGITDDLGREVYEARSGFVSLSAGWGHDLAFIDMPNHYAGISATIASGPEILTYLGKRSTTALLTVGYRCILFRDFSLGLSVRNIGYGLKGVRMSFAEYSNDTATVYRKSTQQDDDYSLTPLTTAAGLGYQRVLFPNTRYAFLFRLEGDLEKEFNAGYYDNLSNIIVRSGQEETFMHTLQTRAGIEYDKAYHAKQFHVGCGLQVINHFSFNYAYIFSNSFQTYRNHQWAISFQANNLFTWKRSDLKWWKAKAGD
ncbi:MAG: hypothetical protein ABSF80_10110 [Chitinispirillaceae bacterium]